MIHDTVFHRHPKRWLIVVLYEKLRKKKHYR